jgi:hypothetical protein
VKHHKKSVDGEVIFDVQYSFDDLYRRIVPWQPANDVDKFIVFFGGSQTFGEGLNDEETIPRWYSRLHALIGFITTRIVAMALIRCCE